MEGAVDELSELWRHGIAAPRTPIDDWCQHVYRERNKAADSLANRAMDTGSSSLWVAGTAASYLNLLCAHFDGGKRGDEAASCGWHLQGGTYSDDNKTSNWHMLAWGCLLLEPTTTSMDAELTGFRKAVQALCAWARNGRLPDNFINKYRHAA